MFPLLYLYKSKYPSYLLNGQNNRPGYDREFAVAEKQSLTPYKDTAG